MDQLKKLVTSLSLKQKISIGVAALVALIGVFAFASWHHQQDFKPLFTGVAPAEAATIVQKIKESGTEYRLTETGGVISVPSAKVAELRLEMAAAGLPKSGRIGFELFDKTSFGTTEFVEHINYMRALEGELERSISTLVAIEHARVHLTPAQSSVFVDSREPAKASVVVTLRPGSRLSPQNVGAIQQLVANAVENLNRDEVSVVDTSGALLSHSKESPEDEASDAAYTRKRKVENDFLERINSTLDPMLGHDKFRAGVAVECDLTSGEQSEETFDPTKSVIVSSQKSEDMTGGATSAGIPGTATNLPRPTPKTSGPATTVSRRTENVNYQSSHVIRKTHLPEGGIKRVSVSVLLDQRLEFTGAGKARKAMLVPPSPDLLKAVHDVVAGLTGFVQERGDQIMISSVPFESTMAQKTATEGAPVVPAAGKPATWKESLRNPATLMAAGAGALCAVAFGLAALLFFKKRKKVKQPETQAALEAGSVRAAIEAANRSEGEDAEQHEQAQLSALASLKLAGATTKKSELLRKEIRDSAKKDVIAATQILQGWIQEGK